MHTPLPFDHGLVESIRVNRSAVERRAATLGTRRTFKVESQAAALIRAVQCMDLTTLAGDDTPGRVERLCAKGRNPVRRDVLRSLGVTDPITVGAICVYHAEVATAVAALQGTGIPVAAVSTDFPDGQNSTHEMKLAQIAAAIEAGATEIDIVITRAHALRGDWHALYDEIVGFRTACGDKAKLKTILGTGNLGTLERIAKASAVAIMAGADTIKTSTGKEGVVLFGKFGGVCSRFLARLSNELVDGLGASSRVVGYDPLLSTGYLPHVRCPDAPPRRSSASVSERAWDDPYLSAEAWSPAAPAPPDAHRSRIPPWSGIHPRHRRASRPFDWCGA